MQAAFFYAHGASTGDTLFVGDVGRTDFLGAENTPKMSAMLYDGIHEKLIPLGDGVIVYPGHGSGSVCGGNIAEREFSSIGSEKAMNPMLILERDEFIKMKDELISELNEMIIKLNNIVPNRLDYNKLMQGEVGIICYFEIETIKNKFTKQTDPYVNIKVLNQDDRKEIINNFETIYIILDNYSNLIS